MTFTPRTWVVGEVVTAALLNAEIRDQFLSFFGAWTSDTPAWTASTTNPVIGNGTLNGRYLKVGRTVHRVVDLLTGSTTTYGSGTYAFSMPVAAASAVNQLGNAQAVGGSSRYAGNILLSPGASTAACYFPDSGLVPVSRLSTMSPTIPFTWAAAFQMRAIITYEAAS
ncbi:hypothetical protein M2158_004094 [Streptomyces sp. SAI-144]|uniref:hypothetical protein n=1 Tax=Streptomyces sp. SAI-144 TaxID=2940544 RepID=UPI002477001C|nr:hypothetical protein [Streptomyces sp. SAI-144]MDH6435617.1 hypothetical protein [Streptomyces sp. SAI-144]